MKAFRSSRPAPTCVSLNVPKSIWQQHLGPAKTESEKMMRLDDAGARRSDGSPLVLLPHDCRRVFASEHLEQQHARAHYSSAARSRLSDTVMIYAKLCPGQLIEEYRKIVRSLDNAYYGEDGLKNPTAEEWGAFAASCNLRDMGTHICALPTGEHCPKGSICLGGAHAQPKTRAVSIFRRLPRAQPRAKKLQVIGRARYRSFR
jgi:hypothetical protein